MILRAAHDEALSQFAALEEEDDFSELMEAPPIRPHSAHELSTTQPDFAKYKVDDLMRRLVSTISNRAEVHWCFGVDSLVD